MKEVKNFDELYLIIQPLVSNVDAGQKVVLKDYHFDFEYFLPHRKPNKGSNPPSSNRVFSKYSFSFQNCSFHNNLIISNNGNDKNLEFNNCTFKNLCKINGSDGEISFYNCTFLEDSVVNCQNATFKGRTRFRNSHFIGNTNFKNATFENYVDFWNSTFYNKTDFYKTDFIGDVYMPAVIFKENVLFTYSLIEKSIILRGAKFEKGLDLSLAMLNGEVNTFQIILSNYKGVDCLTEDSYNSSISDKLEIPNTNKRETFRLLKQINEKGTNLIESLKFKALEKECLYEETKNRKWSWEKIADLSMLFLNKWSNNYGTSIPRAFLFTIGIGFITFLLSVVLTPSYEFTLNSVNWDLNFGMKYFTQFLIPTHRFTYMDSVLETNKWFYLFDFLGRTLVGYGIYQFITAFRKYR